MLLNATCVAIEGKGVLIAGPSGSGKSDLALRLIDQGARLVADDQTEIKAEQGQLTASAPASIAGLMEVRHIGLLRLPVLALTSLALYVDLAPLPEKIERLPDEQAITLLDYSLRRLRLPGFAASTPAKIRAALLYPQAESA